MSIYDLKFYGVYYQYKLEFSGVNIYPTKEERRAVPSFTNSFFEVTVLKEYEGKQDVLKLEFEDGEVAYETYKAPYLYMDMKNKSWKESIDTSVPEAFERAYLLNLYGY